MAYEEDSLEEPRESFQPSPSPEDEVLAELKKIILGAESTQTVDGGPGAAEDQEPAPAVSAESQLYSSSEPEAVNYDSTNNNANTASHDYPADRIGNDTPALDDVIGTIDSELDDVSFQTPLGYLGDNERDAERNAQQHLVFSLSGTRYAVPSANVLEIGRVGSITAAPNTPSWLLGVTNRRGDILSIVDFREFLGLDAAPQDSERMLVVRTIGDEVMTGLIIDQVNGMLYLEPEQIRTPAAPLETRVAQYLVGLCEHKGELVAVLDLETLLQSAEMRQFELV